MVNSRFKFRAWDKNRKKMWSHSDLYKMDCSNEYPFLALIRGFYATNMFPGEEMDVIPMRYTGLEDKNGKEIYEWDIVKGFYDEYNHYFNETNRIEFISDVKWINNGFGVRRLTANYEGRLKDYGYQLCWDAENVEVIGNIFEHKHLLEVTE